MVNITLDYYDKVYALAIRLLVCSLANNMDFDVERIEDLKILVNETLMYKKPQTKVEITINEDYEKKELTLTVKGDEVEIDEIIKPIRESIFTSLTEKSDIKKGQIQLVIGK